MKYEVEIKSLLQSAEKANKLRGKLLNQGIELTNKYKQLNHYFLSNGNFSLLEEKLSYLLDEKNKIKLKEILEKGKKHSLRTREMNGESYLVIKASVDETSSENGILRMEFEERIDISLSKLDSILLDSGFEYQAKWSREREEYAKNDFYITIDKNAGYGYLTEFEIEVNDESMLSDAKNRIKEFMNELGLEELSQDRLARMFEFYNKNWRDYYGTEKIFNIK